MDGERKEDGRTRRSWMERRMRRERKREILYGVGGRDEERWRGEYEKEGGPKGKKRRVGG